MRGAINYLLKLQDIDLPEKMGSQFKIFIDEFEK